ncbi:hypothetical protein NQ315_000044, partial [Exocentrus adspersus]
ERAINTCQSFLELTVRDRIIAIAERRLCKNCFRKNHHTKDCIGSNCKRCNLKHNTLLHLDKDEGPRICSTSDIKMSKGPRVSAFTHNGHQDTASEPRRSTSVGLNCLLPTATSRILLDSASQCSFTISDLLFINLPILDINNAETQVMSETKIKIESIYNNFNCTISCLVLPQITQHLPQFTFDLGTINIPNNIQLADPHFNKSGEIQILLGAELFWKVVCIGQISLGKDLHTYRTKNAVWLDYFRTALHTQYI